MNSKSPVSEISIKVARSNPFDEAFICDIEDLKRIYADEFVDLVRMDNPDLKGVSRAYTGVSGVYKSRFSNFARGEPDLQIDHDDMYPFNKRDDENLYLDTHSKSYVRGEFDQPEDAARFDDEERVLMRNLELKQKQEQENQKITDIDDLEVDTEGEGQFDPNASVSGMDEVDVETEVSPPDEEEMKVQYDGIVRAVKGAYLVSKREQPDGTYTEVWIYNVGEKYDNERNIRSSILAGTDVDPKTNRSEDGLQVADFKTLGNIQFLTITGLSD